MTHGSTNTIVTSITTTNDNDVLVLSGNIGVVSKVGVEQRLRVFVQELHGEVDAVKIAVGNGQVTSDSRTCGNDHSVVLFAQRL